MYRMIVSSVTLCYVLPMTRFDFDTVRMEAELAVEAEGLRPFARRSGVTVGVVRSLIDRRDLSFTNTLAMAAALGLDFYVGPKREIVPVQQIKLDGIDYAHIPLHAASLSAGSGIDNGDNSIIDHLAFRLDWLGKIKVRPDQACLARVERESMAPTIFPGDMVLIDTAHTDPPIRKRGPNDQRRAAIYAFVEAGQARIKRIERPESDVLFLVSDNPDYAPELRTGAQMERLQMSIIGKVVWWGHTA